MTIPSMGTLALKNPKGRLDRSDKPMVRFLARGSSFLIPRTSLSVYRTTLSKYSSPYTTGVMPRIKRLIITNNILYVIPFIESHTVGGGYTYSDIIRGIQLLYVG